MIIILTLGSYHEKCTLVSSKEIMRKLFQARFLVCQQDVQKLVPNKQ